MMIINRRFACLFRIKHRALLVLAIAGFALSSNAQAAQSTSESQKHAVTAQIVTAQQLRYKHLNDIWTDRHIPDGLPKATGAATARNSHVPDVGIRIRNVDYDIADGIGFYIKSLEGALVPNQKGEPINFDNPYTYHIHILKGEVTVRPAELNALFNRYILDYTPRALSSIENHTSNGQLQVDAKTRLFDFLPPISGLPTTLLGTIKLTQDGKLAYTPKTVENFGISIGGLLSALGIKLSTLTPLNRKGVVLDGNTLLMNPETIFPEPRLTIDKVDRVQLSDEGLTLTFSSNVANPHFATPPGHPESYIWLQSGDAKFFNVLLVNARLLMINEHHKILHFYLYNYRQQVAAGRIDALMDGTLIARVPNEFKATTSAPEVTQNAKTIAN